MIAQTSVQTEEKRKRPFTDEILCFPMSIVILAAIGAIIPAFFWGLWYLAVGSIPKFLGVSRFWLDTISGPFYILVVAAYIGIVIEKRGELSEDEIRDGVWDVNFGKFVIECPWLSLIGLFLIIDFVVSISLSFAVGLAGFIALPAVIGIVLFIRWLISIIFASIIFCSLQIDRGESSEEDE